MAVQYNQEEEMILWLLIITVVISTVMMLSAFMHRRHHIKYASSLCRCGHNCKGDFCKCEYFHSFYYHIAWVVVLIAVFSPMFLEYRASLGNAKKYTVVNGQYREINSVVWDLPWGPRIVTVSADTHEYRDSRIISMKGDKIYTLIPVFTWKYSSNPAVYDKTEKLGWPAAEKLFMKFILQNESEIRSLASTIDIKSQKDKKRFENKLRELITSKIQIPGIEFGLEYCAIYEK